jgi:shikimate kinase
MDFIKASGISIYLKMEITFLVNRLSKVRKKRPLLKDYSIPALEQFITTQIAEREQFYNMANYSFEATIPDIQKIFALIPGLPKL